ncbi:MAG TPA: TadE/TadG family type IV pilus assembly protein [Chloroflexia bacterium]
MLRHVYRISRLTKKIPRSRRGQGLYEFSLVSLLLFMILFGIIEMGRFLLAYNVVSNSAQEGVRYGIIRPRDLFSASEAANRRTLGTPIPTQVVVADGTCNVIDKTREKVWGLPGSDLKVAVWFDNGNGTPTVVPMDYDELSEATLPGNRINVESVYHYEFIVPFFQVFAPRGIDVKMRSARTILRWGDEPDSCTVSLTPAPTYTAGPSPTRTPTATATNTSTSTNTATATNTSISTNTTVPASSTPTGTFTPVSTDTPVPTGTATSFTATSTAVPPSSTATKTATSLPISTATSTNTAVATSTNTAVPTSTSTSVPTSTSTATATATPTRRLVISALHLKKRTGATGTLDIGIDLKDDLGNLINGATVNSTGSFSGALPNVGTGIYGFCKTGSYPDPASNITVTISASKVGYQSVSITASATSGYDPLCGP